MEKHMGKARKTGRQLVVSAMTLSMGLGLMGGCQSSQAQSAPAPAPAAKEASGAAGAAKGKTYSGLTEFDHIAGKANAFGKGRVTKADANGDVIVEAEEFQLDGKTDGWRSKDWGENYYAATFAISFLSRKAFLGAPASGAQTVATTQVEIPKAGKYLALVRYEAAFRFETQFTVEIEQNGKSVFKRLYGARDNIKIWPFKGMGGLKTEVGWYWGAVENTVWEGHEAFADLAAGPATIKLIADKQPEPGAKRNVDLVMLTMNKAEVDMRIDKEGYLPLDGLLTQQGDVFMRVVNTGTQAATVTVSPGQEHSPYWVHIRKWKPVVVKVEPGQTSDWADVGAVLDSINDGQWNIATAGKDPKAPMACTLEFSVKNADGTMTPIFKREAKGEKVVLAYDANTRYTKRLRDTEHVLLDLVAYLKAQPFNGKPLERTPVFYYSFKPVEGNPAYSAALAEFTEMFRGVAADDTLVAAGSTGGRNFSVVTKNGARGYTDLRGIGADKIGAEIDKRFPGDQAKGIRVVSLGDEIGLDAPTAGEATNVAFRQWAQGKGYKASQVSAGAGDDWSKVTYDPNPKKRDAQPATYYYSTLYAYDYGMERLKGLTDVILKKMPNADTGANFSPHHGAPFLGSAHQYITLFRRNAMTMPWGEDYIWQIPVGTQQMNNIQLDMFRAANRYAKDRDIHFYVMTHTPGNTVNSWRRLFYSALGSGMTMVNLFEFNPVQVAYTENHTSNPEMYHAVRVAFGELQKFEDVVQDGGVRWGNAALWYSIAGDAWENHAGSFGSAKRTLFVGAQQQQVQLDIVDEEDALTGVLDSYKLLYLADQNVSQKASKAIADWVAKGGRVFASAGAGMFDEYNRPNKTLQALFGVTQTAIADKGNIPILLEKQDLPFSNAVGQVSLTLPSGPVTIDAFGVISTVTAQGTGKVIGTFADKSAAVVENTTGKGKTLYCAFMPGLSYFKTAIPKVPVDRGSTDDAMAHFIPTKFDAGSKALIGLLAQDLERPVTTSSDLVQAKLIQSKTGAAITLTNWNPEPAKGLQVTINAADIPVGKISSASGVPVKVSKVNGKTVVTLDVEVADALILK
jgi:hypothetical protein